MLTNGLGSCGIRTHDPFRDRFLRPARLPLRQATMLAVGVEPTYTNKTPCHSAKQAIF